MFKYASLKFSCTQRHGLTSFFRVLLSQNHTNLSTNRSSESSNGMASQLFQSKDIADAYANFRPVYPYDLKTKIVEYRNRYRKSENDLAVDIGCGSGQSTVMWADLFKSVIGTDVSKAQVDKAPRDINNVTFSVGSAEEIKVKNNTVDLVTIGQAMHWVDTDTFYKEVKRILKPGGVLAVYGYGNLKLGKLEAVEVISKEFYQDTLHGGKFWEPGRKHIDNLYADFTPLPFNDFERIDTLQMEKNWTLDHFIGYVSSWSGYRGYMKQFPDSKILQELKEKLQIIYENNETIKVTWPVFLLLGRN